jgi:uncharacterized SAM-binding protein YcdF (DUF218 family)
VLVGCAVPRSVCVRVACGVWRVLVLFCGCCWLLWLLLAVAGIVVGVLVALLVGAIAFPPPFPRLFLWSVVGGFDFQSFVLNSRIYFIIIYIFV